MEAEYIRQHPDGLVIAERNVHPDQPVVTVEQGLQVLYRVRFNPFVGQ
jgi:hypothetical protein